MVRSHSPFGTAKSGPDLQHLAEPIPTENDARCIAKISSACRSYNCRAYYELFSQQKTRIRRIVLYEALTLRLDIAGRGYNRARFTLTKCLSGYSCMSYERVTAAKP